MNIGLLFYTPVDYPSARYAVEASTIKTLHVNESNGRSVIQTSSGNIYTTTPLQELVDNYTHLVAEALHGVAQ